MRTLPPTTSILELLEERAHTEARLAAYPLTAAWAKDYQPIRADLIKGLTREVELHEALAKARALVFFTDSLLDKALIVIVNTILSLVQNDRQDPLYVRFVGGEAPSRLARPVLGEQLKQMKDWAELLQGSAHPELKALHPELDKLVTQGIDAEAGHAKAKQDKETFATIGEHKTLVDAMNALRKATYGKLAELVHTAAGQNLSGDFAEMFFLRESAKPEPSLDSVDQNINRLTEQLKKQTTLRAELAAAADAQQKRRAEAEAKLLRDELSTLDREIASKQSRAEELRKRLPPTS